MSAVDRARGLSAVVAITHGEGVGYWNVFRKDIADDIREVPYEALTDDAREWLRR